VSVPLPHGFLPVPKLFEAQSADWQELPEEAPARTSRPTPGRSAGAAKHAPIPGAPARTTPTDAAPERAGDPPRIKGAFVAIALDHLRETRGPGGLDRVLGKVPPESAFQLRGVLMPVAWMPASLVGDLAQASEAVFGNGVRRSTSPLEPPSDVVIELGKAVATRALGTTHRHFIQGATPTMAVQRIPKIWRTYHNGGDVVVVRAPSSGWHVQVSGHAPGSMVHAQVMMGFYVGLLELTGAREVRAEVLSCADLGASYTTTELRWR
jgi:hypothetical protein